MGLEDREYMRERRRQESGARRGIVSWSDVSNERHDHRNGRCRSAPLFVAHPRQKWIILLSAIFVLYPAYREAKRGGWLPDVEAAMPFPASGSVTVSRTVDPRIAVSRMRVRASAANAVVQLYDPVSDEHIISVYVRRGDDITIPVPPGTYRMRVIEGERWHGPVRFFGPSTTYESVASLITFTDRQFSGIDLHRRVDGTLRMHVNFGTPPPL